MLTNKSMQQLLTNMQINKYLYLSNHYHCRGSTKTTKTEQKSCGLLKRSTSLLFNKTDTQLTNNTTLTADIHTSNVPYYNLSSAMKHEGEKSSNFFQTLKPFDRSKHYQTEYHLVNEVYKNTGALEDLPKWYRFGILKVVVNLIFFITVGSMISKITVTFLEENDIFKPEDDDDDDYY
jgi:hypothetical protein